jgi:hypothetical protein
MASPSPVPSIRSRRFQLLELPEDVCYFQIVGQTFAGNLVAVVFSDAENAIMMRSMRSLPDSKCVIPFGERKSCCDPGDVVGHPGS